MTAYQVLARRWRPQRFDDLVGQEVVVRTLRPEAQSVRVQPAGVDAELKDPDVVVLMRGFIGGMKYMDPTLKFMGKLLGKDPSCGLSCGLYAVDVEVDPLLFRRYGILQVPAVVYVPDIEVLGPGSEGLGRNAKVARAYAFYGDAALSYSLKRINEEAKSASLAAVIREFTHGFYR